MTVPGRERTGNSPPISHEIMLAFKVALRRPRRAVQTLMNCA